MKKKVFSFERAEARAQAHRVRMRASAFCALASLLAFAALASEDEPYRPFAQWADVPAAGELVVGLVYNESEAYHIWAGHQYQDVSVESGGESYGIDINQGFVALQYGITEKWAADLSVGYATAGSRYFSPHGEVTETTGLMDWGLGVRYQVFNEATAKSAWIPTLTLRAGALLPGTFDEYMPVAPGNRSASIEPEVLARKHFGWPGLGAYFDSLFRWNRTTHNDQYIVAVGLFQQIKGWELDVGYRHLGTITGQSIELGPDYTISYPRELRENRDNVEAGFSYTTSKRHIRYGFQTTTVLNGVNSDGKWWVGGSIDIPFGGSHND